MYKLSDFKVGQEVWIERTGNAARGKKTKDELIFKTTVKFIGRKYITVNDLRDEIKFKEPDARSNYKGLIEHTCYCVDYILYPSYEIISEIIDRREAVDKINQQVRKFNGFKDIPTEDLKQICKLLRVD